MGERNQSEKDEELEKEFRRSRQTGGDAPAAGSVEEREATAKGTDAFSDAAAQSSNDEDKVGENEGPDDADE